MIHFQRRNKIILHFEAKKKSALKANNDSYNNILRNTNNLNKSCIKHLSKIKHIKN